MNEHIIKIIVICTGIVLPVSLYLVSRLIKQYDKQAEQSRENIKELYDRTEKNCRRIDIAETNIKNFRDRLDDAKKND